MKALGLVLTIALLMSVTACYPSGNQNGASPTPTAAASPTPPTSPSPVAPTSPSPGGPAAPTTASVKGSNFKWQDDASGTPVTTIKVGGTVTWTVTGGTHQLKRVAGTAANGCDQLDASFDSSNMTQGQSVTRTFTKAGTFGYQCGIHLGEPNCKTPPGSGPMPGVIKVVP